MEHPLIGVWSVEIHEAGKPYVAQATHTYHADGTMAIATAKYAAHGAWVATGERTAKLAALLPIPPGEGFSGWFSMRANIEVASAGDTFRMDAVVSRPTPSGIPAEHPATVTATRFMVDP